MEPMPGAEPTRDSGGDGDGGDDDDVFDAQRRGRFLNPSNPCTTSPTPRITRMLESEETKQQRCRPCRYGPDGDSRKNE
ncbi:hypothetical protein RB195_020594 [Necator americanus]|uniref:Uncharacterized protein n=1 Tax=Necator americanus TaxID=51031 RepID=A0ABR1CJJ9_NECAM